MLRICDFYKKVESITKIQDVRFVFKSKICNIMVSMNRKWKCYLKQSENTNAGTSKSCFKLLSYNILAQDLLLEHPHLYYKINVEMLRWENRLYRICKEIADIQPDILCLQEVQYDHVKQLVKQISYMHHRKWEYVFKKKTGTRSDGCIIIFDKDKFKLMSERFVEYYTVGVEKLNRENIGLMVKLQERNQKSLFVVATTHLLYNPKREDIRVYQVNKLIEAIVDFSSATEFNHAQLPVILTGDFNFTSDGQAFEALTSLRISNSEKNENGQNKDKTNFQLDAIDFGNVNAASTFHYSWIIVDYILKSRSNSLQVNSVYKLPSLDECRNIGKIPNNFIGSDHFLLAINLTIS